LQKAFDDKFPPLAGRVTPDMMTARAEASRQLQNDLRAALGDDKFAALRHASDTDLRTLDSLATRLNLPSNTTDNIVAARDGYATESQRINSDPSLTPQQRRAQIQELGNRARSDVMRTLGTEGVDAYAQRSPWLGMLQNGMAFSTTPQAGSPAGLGALGAGGATQSVYPVMPAGANAGGARMIVNGVTTMDAPAGGPGGGGIFMVPGGAPRENVQVMSFTTTDSPASSTPTPSPAASTAPTSGQAAPAQPPKP
jgi:hypothetical protein